MTDAREAIVAPGLHIAPYDFGRAHVICWRGEATRPELGSLDLRIAPGHSRGDQPRIIWLAPSEVLVLRWHDVPAMACDGALLLPEVSDAMVAWRIAGSRAHDYLAKGSTLDFDGPTFGVDRSARTRFAQVATTIDQVGNDVYDLYIERSHSRYFTDWLVDAAIEFRA